MRLTEKQREVYNLIKSHIEKTGQPMTASQIIRELGEKKGSVYDRIHSLERKSMVELVLISGKAFYKSLPEPPDEPRKHDTRKKAWINVDHGLANNYKHGGIRNPVTFEEVERAKETIKYKTGKQRGTKILILKRYESDEETGETIRRVATVEPVQPYRHGVLCEGRKIRRFIRWIDVALFLRNPKKPIGDFYWRDDKE